MNVGHGPRIPPSGEVWCLDGGDQSVAQDEALVGCIGTITVATRGSRGPGEVQVKVRGGTESFIAWSPEPLPRGSTVLVIESRGHRTVDVSAWSDPLADFPGLEA
jgi:membrane protein implicated in regulation of membrane protease activity